MRNVLMGLKLRVKVFLHRAWAPTILAMMTHLGSGHLATATC